MCYLCLWLYTGCAGHGALGRLLQSGATAAPEGRDAALGLWGGLAGISGNTGRVSHTSM